MGRHTNKANPMRISRKAQALAASPVVLLLASAIRLILICNYDTANAAAMASFGGIVPTLLGSVIPLLPPFLPLFTLILMLFRRWFFVALAGIATALVSPAYNTWSHGLYYGVHKAGELFREAASPQRTMLLHEAPKVLLCAAVGVVFAVLAAWRTWDSDDEDFVFWLVGRISLVLYGLAVAAACVIGLLFVQAVYRVPFDYKNASAVVRHPWMPAEEVTIKTNGVQRTYIGYVLSSASWFEILLDDERTIVYVKTDTVVARYVCIPPESLEATPFHSPLLSVDGAEPPQRTICDPTSPRRWPNR